MTIEEYHTLPISALLRRHWTVGMARLPVGCVSALLKRTHCMLKFSKFFSSREMYIRFL